VPCARLSWPSRQLLSARKYTVSYRSESRGVPVYTPDFAAYPRTDGQAELAWIAGCIPRRFVRPQTVTRRSANRTQRRVTSCKSGDMLTKPQKAHSWAERRHMLCIDRQNRSTDATCTECAHDEGTKKRQKKRNLTVANLVFVQATHVVGSKSNFAWR